MVCALGKISRNQRREDGGGEEDSGNVNVDSSGESLLDPSQYRMTEREKQELRQTKTFRKIEADIKDKIRRSKKSMESEAKAAAGQYF